MRLMGNTAQVSTSGDIKDLRREVRVINVLVDREWEDVRLLD